MSIHFRARLFAPGSTTTVLTPPATSADGTARPHADAFQVSTLAGVAGYVPYLRMPTAQRGSLDIGSKQTSVGECVLRLIDVSTDGTNAARWASAFLADSKARSNVLGCLVEFDITRDTGGSWSPWFTGKVASRSLDDLLTYGLAVREESDRLQRRVFVGQPHASATASVSPLWPLGRLRPWGDGFAALQPIQGSNSGGPLYLFQVSPAWERTFTNRISTVLAQKGDVVQGTGYGFPAFTQDAVPRVLFSNGAIGKVSGLVVDQVLQSITQVQWILESGTPPSGATAAVIIDAPTVAPTERTPLLIGPVHPVTLWRQLLDGWYGRLVGGAVPTGSAVRYNATAFSAAESWALPDVRVRVDESAEMGAWIEQHILAPFHLAYHVNASGEIVPVDLRRRSSYPGILTITDADLASVPRGWREDSAGAYERLDVTIQRDRAVTPSGAAGEWDEATCLVATTAEDRVAVIGDERQVQIGRSVLDLAPATWRVAGETPTEVIAADAARLEAELRGWIGYGERRLPLETRAASANADVWPGQYCIVNVSSLPHFASNRRGGSRLALCVDRVDAGKVRSLSLLDAGPSAAANTPTLASLALGTGVVTATVTRNAQNDDVELWYAHTTTAVGTPPAEASPLWTRFGVVSANGSAPVAPRPLYGRVWVRARSVTDRAALDPKQPSTFVTASPAFVDVTGAPTFGSLTATEDGTTETYDLAWTNTDSTYPVLVTLTPSGGVAQLLATLPAGASTYRVYHTSDPRGAAGPLVNGVAYTVTVTLAHPDFGAGRLTASAAFTTGTAVPPAAPTVSVSVSDWAPSGNLSNAALTYAATGGTLTVTKNGASVTPGASPWSVARPAAGASDTYVFTCTPAHGAPVRTTVQVSSNEFLATDSPGGIVRTRPYGTQVWREKPGTTNSGSWGRAYYEVGAGEVAYLWATLPIPDGSTLTAVEVYRSADPLTVNTLKLRAYRHNDATGVTQIGAEFSETVSGAGWAGLTGLAQAIGVGESLLVEVEGAMTSAAQQLDIGRVRFTVILPTVVDGLG